jgi:hypothetical protein
MNTCGFVLSYDKPCIFLARGSTKSNYIKKLSTMKSTKIMVKKMVYFVVLTGMHVV